ncbi:hypothetical protein FSP39_002119 [Pinctada imbricata]|uniref:HTH psq-type domain-containing protein n=1 Tax=Pinctada imbricata TaxID=66713 RepID=A0AA88YMU4_PINIB|nr:hypothetical protein FSP39_002119 [Pinctada imbricata]
MPKKYIHKGRGKEMGYSLTQMEEAVKAVKEGRFSIRGASKEFSVPKSTLQDKISGRTEVGVPLGRRPALPVEMENKIVQTVKTAARQGMGITRRQLLQRTGVLCKRTKLNAFKNGAPTKDWWQSLKKRHPELAVRKAEALGSSRASMMNPVIVEGHFDALEKELSSMNLTDKPELIWNCDETGKCFEHSPGKVIAEKGSRNVVGKVTNNRSHITIMACVNAAGRKMSPMLIAAGKTTVSLHGFNAEMAPAGTKWAFQENGWITDEIVEKWFTSVFLQECGPERPQILILDRHKTHECLAFLELAIENGIILYGLPSHTTHMLQPLDRTVFGPFGSYYDQFCSEFLSSDPLHLINKWTFPSIFTKAWEAALSSDNITSGFKACGIYPFNRNAIPKDAMLPSQPTETSPPPSSDVVL